MSDDGCASRYRCIKKNSHMGDHSVVPMFPDEEIQRGALLAKRVEELEDILGDAYDAMSASRNVIADGTKYYGLIREIDEARDRARAALDQGKGTK